MNGKMEKKTKGDVMRLYRIRWPEVEQIVKHYQPNGRMPKQNRSGWIGPLHSPLREDRHPSFSVLPDTSDDPGAYKDHATGEHGSMADLARRLGIETKYQRIR